MRSQGRDIKTKLERFGLRILQEWDGEGTWTTMLVSAGSEGRLEWWNDVFYSVSCLLYSSCKVCTYE